MLIRRLLHNPQTVYIVMVRNYADMVWSAYNFWCKREYDGVDCDSTHWAQIGKHTRSPELFHEMIEGDRNGTKVPHPIFIDKPCQNARSFYESYFEDKVFPYVNRSQTLIVSNEHLERDPQGIWERLLTLFPQIPASTIKLGNFSNLRFNTQENKGTDHSQLLSTYRSGVYAISNYQPMMNSTRELLNSCWKNDCEYITKMSSYSYPVCVVPVNN